jgi:hypothetical protein
MPKNLFLTRWVAAVGTILAFIVITASCQPSDDPDIESLGLAIETDIPAGGTFEVAVPKLADTTVAVETTPPGVTAAITNAPGEGMILLTVNVEFDTPRGDYNLGLAVVRNGEEYLLGWPFEVVEPGGPAPTSLPDTTTQGAAIDPQLIVEHPQPGDPMVSGDVVAGLTSTDAVGYRLVGGGDVLIDAGTLTAVDGRFESPVEFANTCCIEMRLEVFHVEDGGMIVAIPVTYPEGG